MYFPVIVEAEVSETKVWAPADHPWQTVKGGKGQGAKLAL